ncbi:hypothetical protein CA51_01370 [Rosistilla oblonga]|nr:hypothetical protein CA51_01370 [Rosistilla oblonga]
MKYDPEGMREGRRRSPRSGAPPESEGPREMVPEGSQIGGFATEDSEATEGYSKRIDVLFSAPLVNR